jgi:hypothetical protein
MFPVTQQVPINSDFMPGRLSVCRVFPGGGINRYEETEAMKKFFRTPVGSLIALTALTLGLNIVAWWVSHWVFTTIVFIHDLGLIVCFLLWTSHHVLKFARPAAREYKKLRDDLRDE